jgi:hypothetical protein
MERMTICYHFPSLDTMLGLAFVKLYFAKYQNYSFNFYQANHRTVFDKVLQVSNTIYFIGILPSDTVLQASLKLGTYVIIIDNKVDDMRRLQEKSKETEMRRLLERSKVEDMQRLQERSRVREHGLRFVYPPNEGNCTVFQLCKDYFKQTTPQNLALLATYVHDIEFNLFKQSNSNQMACALYAL